MFGVLRVKAKYAPWVDILLRCEGPVIRQAQHLFLATWIAETGEDRYGLPAAAPAPAQHHDGAVDPMVPFGGAKHSGYGLEFGAEGLKAASVPR